MHRLNRLLSTIALPVASLGNTVSLRAPMSAVSARLGAPVVSPSYASMTAPANTTGNYAYFDVYNSDWQAESYSVYCWASGAVTSCNAPWSIFVDGNSYAYVDAMFATSSPGTGGVSISVGGMIGDGSGYYDVTVQNPQVPPVLTVASNGDFRDVSRCLASCFEYVTTYSTPAYFSRGIARTTTLMYRSGSAHPMGVVQLDVTDNASTPADAFKLELRRPDNSLVTFLNGQPALYFASPHYTGSTTRVIGVFDAMSLPTGSYPYIAVVTSIWSNAQLSTNQSVRVIVLNESASPLGAGWTVAGVQHLSVQSDGVLATDGSGSASFYYGQCGSGTTCTYTSPGGEFATLTKNSDGTYWRRYPDGGYVAFSADGTAFYVADRFTNGVQFFSFSNGKLQSIGDAAVQYTYFGYETNGGGWTKLGTLRSIATPGGRTAWFGVDVNNHLTDLLDVDGIYYGFASYASDHRMTQFRDRGGFYWNSYYAWDGTIDSAKAPTITAVVNGASQSLRPTSKFSGPATRLTTAISNGAGTAANPVPSGLDTRVTLTNPRGFTTYGTLNRWGSATIITTPISTISYNLEYDATTGKLTRAVGPGSHDVRFTWSGPNLTQISDVSTGKTVNASYETTYNQVDHIWGNATLEQWRYYDAARPGKPLYASREGVSTAPLTQYNFDGYGRLTQATDIAGHTTGTFFASTGFQNVDSVVAPGHRLQTFRYDNYGRLVAARVPDLNLRDSVEYDPVNRVVAAIDGKNRRTSYLFDSLYLRVVVDPIGQRDSVVRNALGWSTLEMRPASSVPLQWAYDLNGNVVSATNRRGQTATVAYDALDRDTLRAANGDTARMTLVQYSSPSNSIVALVIGRNGEGVDSSYYDVDGHVRRRTVVLNGSWYAFDYAYWPNGTLQRRDGTSNQWAGLKTVSYGYNAVHTIQSITAFGQSTNIGLNSENLTTTVTYPNGLVNNLSNTTNHENYLSSFSGTGAADVNTRLGTALKLDVNGRIVEHRRSVGDSLKYMLYDLDGTLQGRQIFQSTQQSCQNISETQALGYSCVTTEPLDHTEPFTYDGAGNLMNGVTQLDPGNRIRVANGSSYNYDADGNLSYSSQFGIVRELTWDAVGQLTNVQINGTTSVSYGYDAFGRRVRKTVNGVTTRYVYEGDNLFAITNAAGAVTSEFANWPGIDAPHSVQIAGETYYYAFEPVSQSVHGLIRASDKAVVAQYGFTPFGQMEGGSFDNIPNGGNPLRFGGREYDFETGLYYFRARYYEPQLGRFISEDPLGVAAGSNLYAFAANDPVNATDPSGLFVGGLFHMASCVYQHGMFCLKILFGGPKRFVSPLSSPAPPPGMTPQIYSSPDSKYKPVSALRKPGVYVGSHGIRSRDSYYKHTAIAVRYPNGTSSIIELRGTETQDGGNLYTEYEEFFTGVPNRVTIGTKPLYGNDYTWVRVGDAGDIVAVAAAMNQAQYSYLGKHYEIADSNRFIAEILERSELELTPAQNATLGCAPGLNCINTIIDLLFKWPW